MKHAEFQIGAEFRCGDGAWRCTDKGSRVIIAIRLDQVTIITFDPKTDLKAQRAITRAEAEAGGWFNGPPYAVLETVFDEEDQVGCEPI